MEFGLVSNRCFILFMNVGVDAEDAVCIFLVAVVAQFVGNIKDKEQAEGNANGKAQHIQKAIPFVFFKIAKGNKQQVFYHKKNFEL